jgi:hypothetical protein
MSLPGQPDPAKIDGAAWSLRPLRVSCWAVLGVRYIRLVPDPAAKDQRSAIIRQRPHDSSLPLLVPPSSRRALLEEPFKLPGPLR